MLPAADSIASQLPTGHYDYDLKFTVTYQNDAFTRTIRGSTEIVNTTDPTVGEREFGSRWRLDELDRLRPDDGGWLWVAANHSLTFGADHPIRS